MNIRRRMQDGFDDPEDTLAQQEVEGRKRRAPKCAAGYPLPLNIDESCPVCGSTRSDECGRPDGYYGSEFFGHQSPAEDHAAYLASDSGPYGFGDIELPEE